MWRVGALMSVLSDLAPLSLAMQGDPVGLIAGRSDRIVRKVLIALDVTRETIKEAEKLKADLIVSHHNLYHGACPRPTDDTPAGDLLLTLCERNISLICMHTNLDAANGGINDVLASRIGIHGALGVLEPDTGIGRFGALAEPVSVRDFAARCKKTLDTCVVRYHDAGRPVLLVAVCGGSGGTDVALAQSHGCDTLVTADVKHHQFLEARYWGINLLDCGHFATESVILKPLYDWLCVMTPDLELEIFNNQLEPYQCL